MLRWNYDIIKNSFGFPELSSMKNINLKFWQRRPQRIERLNEKDDTEMDPHYRQMLAYNEVPSWWYMAIFTFSVIIRLFCIYTLNSTLPWWGFFIAIILSFGCTFFFGALTGLIGFQVPITTLIQLIGGYLHPGKPVANMYFVLFGANAESQALVLVESLKLGQYGKRSPKCTFTVQIVGTLLGAVINYVLMTSITTY